MKNGLPLVLFSMGIQLVLVLTEGLRKVINMDKNPLLSLCISVYHMCIIICISSYISYISIKTCLGLHVSAIKASNAKSNLRYILYTGVVGVNNVSIA